jgi:hypothetical protein
MPDPVNPYATAAVPTIEHRSRTQTVLTDLDGTTTPLGATDETVFVNPVTGARVAYVTHEHVRTDEGILIQNPREAVVAWCATCNQRLLDPRITRVVPCSACGKPTCEHCLKTSTNNLPFCPACWHSSRWGRFLAWLRKID